MRGAKITAVNKKAEVEEVGDEDVRPLHRCAAFTCGKQELQRLCVWSNEARAKGGR